MTSTDPQRVNLIPIVRLQRQTRDRALRVWIMVFSVCLFLCALPLIGTVLSPKPVHGMLAENTEKNLNNVASNTQHNEMMSARRESLSAQAQAVSMLERRVRWTGIFRALASARVQTVFFDGIECTSIENDSGDRIEIIVSGYAQSQAETRKFVVSLEALGLFDEVALNNTERVVRDEIEEIVFRITLVLDPSMQTTASQGGGD